jgi:osmoprotectant transport system permease protein
MSWVWSHLDLVWSLALTHMALCVPAIVLGFVISVPLGYLASRSAPARSVLLTLGNVAYTIPGIALVVLVPVVLGLPILDPLNVVLALLLYAVAIMVRSAADAFAAVSADVRQAAVAQGFGPRQRFWRVELPLAGPVLLAGLRVVSVSTISLATVAALVGIPSLGSFFTDGFQRSFAIETITGLVAVLLLAAVFDLVIGFIGRLLMPWTRRQRLSRGAAKVLSQPMPNAGVR